MDHSSLLIMQSLPGTLVALRKKTGFARSTVARTVVKLRADHMLYIAEWVESAVGPSGPLLAVYRKGDHPDAVCPFVTKARVKGQPIDGLGRARAKAIADAERVSKVRDPMLWMLFDVNVRF